jgi:hypothetical protein
MQLIGQCHLLHHKIVVKHKDNEVLVHTNLKRLGGECSDVFVLGEGVLVSGWVKLP